MREFHENRSLEPRFSTQKLIFLLCRDLGEMCLILGRLRETAAPEMVFVRLGGPDFLRGSFAGSFAGVCARDSSFYSVAAVQSVRFEVRRSRKSAPGSLRGGIFPSLFDPRRKQGYVFFPNLFWGHFLRHFSDFFWKCGDPQIPSGTLLRLKRIGILKFQVCFSLGPFFEKVRFPNFRIRKKSTRKLPGGTPAPLLL